ncbi:MAG: MMPL family transporter, partial [Pseudomonadota bacterium]
MSHVDFSRIVDFCIRRAWLILLASALILAGAVDYVAGHFAVNSNIDSHLSPNLPWRQRELAYKAAFPQQVQSTLAVVTAPTPEFASAAADALVARLSPQTALFHSVGGGLGGEFFARNGLLYSSAKEVADRMGRLSAAAPLIRPLVADPSLRGLTHALTMALEGVAVGRLHLDAMARPLNMIAETVESALAGRPARFSWQELVNGRQATSEELRRVIDIWPVLHFRAVEPGQASSAAIRKAAADARLKSDYDASVQMTGPVPLADAQFATLR